VNTGLGQGWGKRSINCGVETKLGKNAQVLAGLGKSFNKLQFERGWG